VGTREGTNGGPALAVRYREAFAAYLSDRDEQALGVAYDLGREAVAAHLSVLDLAEAHHDALRAALDGEELSEAALDASADFMRESLSTFESVHRGYLEVQEVARIEHEHVEQLRALADASVAINSSLTVEEILQLTADTARRVIGAGRATVAIVAPDRRLRPLTATSPPRLGGGDPDPSRLTARLTGRGQELGMLELIDRRDREFDDRDQAIVTQLAQMASVAISNAQLYERERTISRTLQRSLRPGGLPLVSGLSAAVRFHPAGEGIELGGDFYDLFAAGPGAWTALIGDVQGKGPDAAAVTALARHTMRAAAAYESRPSGVLALLHRALRDQSAEDGRFCTVCYAHLRMTRERVSLELACAGIRCRPWCTPTAGCSRSGASARCSARTSEPLLTDVAVQLDAGDVLVLYTDGVTEVRRGRQEVFGHRELVALLERCAGLPPDAVADRVEGAVIAASDGRLRDDMAILAFGPTPRPKETAG
jgi:serine phosphatase RsbU (regulator of sigma subunit)